VRVNDAAAVFFESSRLFIFGRYLAASMKKTILLYGFLLAALTGLLKFLEYRYFVRDLSVEFYVGAIALFFTGLGIWVGLKMTRRKTPGGAGSNPPLPTTNTPPLTNEELLQQTGISRREFEVLVLMSKGYSNQEIADQLFLSLNTVKTHCSNLFLKLDVKRRTQAIQRGKELGLLAI
jgi:DNA-binding CsgD family transcriptional regulator